MLDQDGAHEAGPGGTERLEPRQLEPARPHRDRRAHREARDGERHRGDRDDPQRCLHPDPQRPLGGDGPGGHPVDRDAEVPLPDLLDQRGRARVGDLEPPLVQQRVGRRAEQGRARQQVAVGQDPGARGQARQVRDLPLDDHRHADAAQVQLELVADGEGEPGHQRVGDDHRDRPGRRERRGGEPGAAEEELDRVDRPGDAQHLALGPEREQGPLVVLLEGALHGPGGCGQRDRGDRVDRGAGRPLDRPEVPQPHVHLHVGLPRAEQVAGVGRVGQGLRDDPDQPQAG